MTDRAANVTNGRRAGLETSSSSTVGDDDNSNVDIEALRLKNTAPHDITLTEKTHDEGVGNVDGTISEKAGRKARRQDQEAGGGGGEDEISEMAKRNAAEGDFPEGGFHAWAGVASTALSLAFSFGLLNAFGVFQEYYTSSYLQGYTQSDIAWIGALQYFFIFGVGLAAGRAFDLGLFKPLMAFAVLLFAFSQMMLSLCSSYYQIILAQGVGVGLSMGLLFNLAIGIPAHWFQKRRAFALGIQSTGSSLGGVIFPIMIRQLLPRIGFPWTMRLIGFLGLFLLGGSWFFMNTRLPPLQNIKNGGWKKVKWFDASAFKQWDYTLFVIGCTIILFGLYTPFVYISTFTTQYNIPASDYWLSVLNAASIFGRIIPGILADRYGRMNTIIPHTALAAVILFIFPLFTNLSIIAFVLIFGYCSGCFVSLIAPSAAQLGSTSTVGTRLGILFFVMSIGGLLGTPISGYILGSEPPLHWWATAGYSASFVIVGVLFSVAARHCALNGKLRGKI